MPLLLLEALRQDATPERRARGLQGVEINVDWLEAARQRRAQEGAPAAVSAIERLTRGGAALVIVATVCGVLVAGLEALR